MDTTSESQSQIHWEAEQTQIESLGNGDVPWGGGSIRIALLGNPNTGKTTLFNRLSGLRQQTSNFPGTTQGALIGWVRLDGPSKPVRGGCESCHGSGLQGEPGEGVNAELIDLPGIYSLELAQPEAELCRAVLDGTAAPRGEALEAPDAVLVVADANNLARNLMLVGESLRRRLPTVVVINMIDLARKRGLDLNAERLEQRLGCEVVLCSARTGEGLDELRRALRRPQIPNRTPPGGEDALVKWADDAFKATVDGSRLSDEDELTDRLDRILTHPILGLISFALIMMGLFWAIFKLATYPMGWIDGIFIHLGALVAAVIPEGLIQNLLAGGVVAGVGATVIFLPQICLLFFLISLLEDTGYLARAALIVDRMFRPFGLSGHSFVPLLSAHACALPAIMATRSVPDRRDRLATVLVAPFMACAARIPVYVLLVAILFPGKPAIQALAFSGCYVLGAAAGLFSAMLVRRTILRGKSRPMAIELPSYKLPSVRKAFMVTYDRGMIFLKSAGTMILALSILLWWLGAYPVVDPPAEVVSLREQAALVNDPGQAAVMEADARRLEASHASSNSFIGRLGVLMEPVFAPLGYDRQLTVGVLASFAAREVFVTTMAIVVVGAEDIEGVGVRAALAGAMRDDGKTLVFTRAVSVSLLIYYVLAMQCLPTLVLTARETGGIRWAGLQLVWMSGLAYVAAAVVYQLMK